MTDFRAQLARIRARQAAEQRPLALPEQPAPPATSPAGASPRDLVEAAVRRIDRSLEERPRVCAGTRAAQERVDAVWQQVERGEATRADLLRALDAWERAWRMP